MLSFTSTFVFASVASLALAPVANMNFYDAVTSADWVSSSDA